MWLTIPFATLVSWVFLTADKIGDWSENPFEGLANDVPIKNMARGIERDIRQMLDETDLPMTDVAFSSGFSSLKRFNTAMRETFGRTPSELRRIGRGRGRRDGLGRACERRWRLDPDPGGALWSRGAEADAGAELVRARRGRAMGAVVPFRVA